MAGTKEKPCKECIWDNFDRWRKASLKDGRDVCYLCHKANNWEKYNKTNPADS